MPHPARSGRPAPGKTRLGAAGLAMACILAGTAGHAQDRVPPPAGADAFTPAQRDAIVAIVRNALKTDPTILGDAIVSLRATAQQKADADTDAAVQANRAALSGQPGDAILGNPHGNATIVEFYDPRCPYCRKVLPDLDALLAGDHQIRLVEKLIPILGPNSLLDAQAIQAAAAQGQYANLQRALMTDTGAPGLDRIRTLAAGIGLDVPRLLRDMKSPEVRDVLERNVALAKTLQMTGTPTFVIGDQVIPGAVEVGDLRQAVRAERARR